jgi:hypothetical protein
MALSSSVMAIPRFPESAFWVSQSVWELEATRHSNSLIYIIAKQVLEA